MTYMFEAKVPLLLIKKHISCVSQSSQHNDGRHKNEADGAFTTLDPFLGLDLEIFLYPAVPQSKTLNVSVFSPYCVKNKAQEGRAA